MLRLNRVLGLILLMAIIIGMMGLGARHQMDMNSKQVYLVMDYQNILVQAKEHNIPVEGILSALKAAGLDAVGLRERTVSGINGAGEIILSTGQDLAGHVEVEYGDTVAIPDYIKVDRVYIACQDERLFLWLKDALMMRLPAGTVLDISTDTIRILEIESDINTVKLLRTGFFLDPLVPLQDSGLELAVTFYHYDRLDREALAESFAQLERYAPIGAVMCDGPVVYGYPDLIDDFAFNIQRNQAVFGLFFNGDTLLSHLPLVGERELASAIDYRVGRVATTAQYEFEQMTIDRLIQWGVELVKEYNIRIYYTRPLVVTNGKDFVTINTGFIQDIRSQFAKAGYSTGPVREYPNFAPPWWMSLILMMGMVSAAMILLMRLRPLPVIHAWLLLAFGFLFALLSMMWEGAELLHAAWPLGGAVVFSALAVVGLMNNPWLTAGKTTNRLAMIVTGVRLWLNACFVSLAGACIVAAYLTDIRHVLDMDFFRGVKLMYILPLAIVAVSYYWGSSFSREAMAVSGQRTLFPRRWQRSDIMILGFCGIVLAVYMLRSGHTSVSTWELTIRQYLDHLLWVRPRTKEFLVGHPFLILAVAAAVRGWRRYLGLVFILGAIGQISIINTFVHIRAPLMMGVIRTGNGLWLGATVGVIGILVFDGFLRWHEKRVRG